MHSILVHICLILCLLPFTTKAQINNCLGAQVVCSSENIVLNPQGPGQNDFADPDNDPGCMVDLEHHTAWYYIQINDNAPAGLELGFILNPNGGLGEDYDWALFGPNDPCNDLGSPIRCSSSSESCDFCPQTGMGMGTVDVTEGPGSGDGFVMTLPVLAGEGYYLMIDNFYGSQQGFVLSWTGTAAAHLNCDAVPCNLVADAGDDITTCGGDQPPIPLNGTVTGDRGNASYSWSGTNGGTDFLDNPGVADPSILLPADFIGTINYTLTVTEDSCTSTDVVTVNFLPFQIVIDPVDPVCASAAPVALFAFPPGGMWGGAADGNEFDPMKFSPGIHTVTYTVNNPPCINTVSMEIEVLPPSGITIDAGDNIELDLGEQGMAEAFTNFTFDQIDTVIWSPDSIVECLDPLCLSVNITALHDISLRATVFDIGGCSSYDDLLIRITKDRRIYIPTVFSPNNDGINDVFFVSGNGKQIASIRKLTIYNRWGAIIHESKNLLPDDETQGWNVIDAKHIINPGVYVYTIEVEFINGEVRVYSGDVTVMR